MKKFSFIVLILLSVFVCCGFTACQTISDRIPLEMKSKAEKQIAALKVEYEQKLMVKTDELSHAKDDALKAKDTQEQGAIDAFYSLDRLFGYIPSPVRTDIMWHNYSLEGWAALGHRTPSYDAMVKMNERITTELNETKTNIADLTKRHDEVVAANSKLADDEKKAEEKIVAITQEKSALEKDYNSKILTKQEELNQANNRVIATEKARADDAAAIQALKTRISLICGAIALICTVAAIYLPIGRGVAIVVGLIAAAGGSLIWIITGPQVLIGCGVGLLGAIGYLLYKHHIADKGVKAFANLLGEKPELVAAADEWTTKYVQSKDGTVTTVPDTAVQALVKSKLIANDKA
jgi:hypothetical protein